ncbi:hypothetical protein J6A31_04975 [bacterium]|nr:hypothetical protein [bacterium]
MRLKELIIKGYVDDPIYIYSKKEIKALLKENSLEENIEDALFLLDKSCINAFDYYLPYQYAEYLVKEYVVILKKSNLFNSACERNANIIANSFHRAFDDGIYSDSSSFVKEALCLYTYDSDAILSADFMANYLRSKPDVRRKLMIKFKKYYNILVCNDMCQDEHEKCYVAFKKHMSEDFNDTETFYSIFEDERPDENESSDAFVSENDNQEELTQTYENMFGGCEQSSIFHIYNKYASDDYKRADDRHYKLRELSNMSKFVDEMRDWSKTKLWLLRERSSLIIDMEVRSRNALILMGEWDKSKQKAYEERMNNYTESTIQRYEIRNGHSVADEELPYDKHVWRDKALEFYNLCDKDVSSAFQFTNDKFELSMWFEFYKINLMNCGKWTREFNRIYRDYLVAWLLVGVDEFTSEPQDKIGIAKEFFMNEVHNDIYDSDMMFYAYAYRSFLIDSGEWDKTLKSQYKKIKARYKKCAYSDSFPYL